MDYPKHGRTVIALHLSELDCRYLESLVQQNLDEWIEGDSSDSDAFTKGWAIRQATRILASLSNRSHA